MRRWHNWKARTRRSRRRIAAYVKLSAWRRVSAANSLALILFHQLTFASNLDQALKRLLPDVQPATPARFS